MCRGLKGARPVTRGWGTTTRSRGSRGHNNPHCFWQLSLASSSRREVLSESWREKWILSLSLDRAPRITSLDRATRDWLPLSVDPERRSRTKGGVARRPVMVLHCLPACLRYPRGRPALRKLRPLIPTVIPPSLSHFLLRSVYLVPPRRPLLSFAARPPHVRHVPIRLSFSGRHFARISIPYARFPRFAERPTTTQLSRAGDYYRFSGTRPDSNERASIHPTVSNNRVESRVLRSDVSDNVSETLLHIGENRANFCRRRVSLVFSFLLFRPETIETIKNSESFVIRDVGSIGTPRFSRKLSVSSEMLESDNYHA